MIDPMHKLELVAGGFTIDAAGEDGTPRRTITGVAVPYGETASVSSGVRVRFLPGSLPLGGKAPKLFMYHDATQPVGLVTERVETEQGMMFAAKIASTKAGDEALQLAVEGVLDSVSVGVNPTKFKFADDGVMEVEQAEWMELSLVPVPAFAGAQIAQVAAEASIPQETETDTMLNTDIPKEEAPVSEETPVVIEAQQVTQTVFAQPTQPVRLPTPGEWIAAYRAGGADFAQLNANVLASVPRSPIQAAAGDVTTAEADGVLPTPILGPIFDAIQKTRPGVTAVGVRAMPGAGKVFIRPVVKTRTLVEKQSAELANLSTRSFETDDIQITKETFGGRVLLSEQVIDWSEPSMLDAVLTDLAQEYAATTEARIFGSVSSSGVVRDAMSAGQGEQATNFTAADEVIKAFYSAAGKIAADTGYLPTHLICHPLMWTKIGQLTDNNKRPLFPTIAPQNAGGTSGLNAYTSNVLGLTLVVSREMAGASFFGSKNANDVYVMFNARNIELYEQQKGTVRVDVPEKLAVNLAFRGYFQGVVLEKLGFKVIYTGTL